MVRATVTTAVAVGTDGGALAMPRSTMSLPSSGSMTPRSASDHVGGCGSGVGTADSTGPSRVNLHGRWRGAPPRPARPPQGAGRQHPLRHLPRAGPLARAAGDGRGRRDPRSARQHRAPHLERMREVGLLEVVTDPRGAVGRPQHRYSLAADAPSLGFEPPRSRCSPGCSLGGRRPGRRRRRRRRGRPARAGLEEAEAGPDRRRRATEAARRGSPPRLRPRRSRRRRATTVAFTRCPFQTSPRPTPTWSAACTGAWSRASSTRRGGEVLDFGTSSTAILAASRWPTG